MSNMLTTSIFYVFYVIWMVKGYTGIPRIDETVLEKSTYRELHLIKILVTHLIVGYEGHTCWVCLVKKLMYFVNISHNPMNSDPKFTTSCRDPPAKTSRVVINLFLEPKMRSPLEVSTIGVMFSVHGDSVRPILPLRTFSVGFEQ